MKTFLKFCALVCKTEGFVVSVVLGFLFVWPIAWAIYLASPEELDPKYIFLIFGPHLLGASLILLCLVLGWVGEAIGGVSKAYKAATKLWREASEGVEMENKS